MGNSERVQAADAARHCGFTFRGKATWVTETVKLLCKLASVLVETLPRANKRPELPCGKLGKGGQS